MPRTHNSFGDRSFGAVGPWIWNSLPRGLRTLDISYKHFKALLKTYMFRQGALTFYISVLEIFLLSYLLVWRSNTSIVRWSTYTVDDQRQSWCIGLNRPFLHTVVTLTKFILISETVLRITIAKLHVGVKEQAGMLQHGLCRHSWYGASPTERVTSESLRINNSL